MTATEQFINTLSNLKAGDMGLLRSHAGQGLDESVQAFDLFAGIWWPLRQRNQRAPRRKVAWLIAKLYAACPLQHADGARLPALLRRASYRNPQRSDRFEDKIDEILTLPVDALETPLLWALQRVAEVSPCVDWVKLTDDLSIWERESVRGRWAAEYLKTEEREEGC